MGRSTSPSDLLRVWERGDSRPLPERALELLALALPDAPWDELAALSLAARDRELLRLRAALFGESLDATARCPACAGTVAFRTTVPEMLRALSGDAPVQRLDLEGDTFRVRPPNALDLVLAARCADAAAATRLVMQRCVSTDTGAPDDGSMTAGAGADGAGPAARDNGWFDGLPDAAQAALAAAMDRVTEPASLQIALACADCGAHVPVEFDIVPFLWREVAAEAKRLASQVVLLARAFAWRERDILELSAARRRLYLELAGG